MALHGLNLGGWLIAEDWITRTLFHGVAVTDEYGLLQERGGVKRLREHQHKFITEADFKWMAINGVQIVRLPVGYWVLRGDKPYHSAIGRVDWAFKMCKKYHILMLLDIHGLPGSQNGQNHSGKTGHARWQSGGGNPAKGLEATVQIAQRYAGHPMLWGIQIMNEPPVKLLNIQLRHYYNRAYRSLSALLPPGVRVIYSDGFTPRLMSGAIWANKKTPAVMDVHWYHFAGWQFMGPRAYKYIVRSHGRLLRLLKRWNGVIVGEWSGLYAQRIFDKYPVSEHAAMVGALVAEQLRAYESADAWFYWTYKTEQPGSWSYRSLVEDGTIARA